MATFSERLRELRKENRITQQELADKFFITKSAVSKYENGVNTPENKLLQDLADYFNVSIDYLLGRTNNNSTKVEYGINDKAKEILEVIKKAGVDLENIDYTKLEQLLKLSNIEKEK
ncbi:helix-turn-helix domain-containing protein [Clostridium neonatale]|uniref:helix-turn-helix domain-containing protein n=1 Tax=Clostridium neonatale TaxID=137838 RepID=UPI00291C10D7|nr:hypothetical protein CNEO4_240006 [Clostridium neonatale]